MTVRNPACFGRTYWLAFVAASFAGSANEPSRAHLVRQDLLHQVAFAFLPSWVPLVDRVDLRAPTLPRVYPSVVPLDPDGLDPDPSAGHEAFPEVAFLPDEER